MKLQCATSNLICFAAISAFQSSALAELVFDIHHTSYKVQKSGNQPITYDQLITQWQDCNKQSPFVACTIASHSYSFELIKSPLPCQVAKLDLNVKIRVLLPDFGDLLPSDQERLLGFSNKMSKHEAEHVDKYYFSYYYLDPHIHFAAQRVNGI